MLHTFQVADPIAALRHGRVTGERPVRWTISEEIVSLITGELGVLVPVEFRRRRWCRGHRKEKLTTPMQGGAATCLRLSGAHSGESSMEPWKSTPKPAMTGNKPAMTGSKPTTSSAKPTDASCCQPSSTAKKPTTKK